MNTSATSANSASRLSKRMTIQRACLVLSAIGLPSLSG